MAAQLTRRAQRAYWMQENLHSLLPSVTRAHPDAIKRSTEGTVLHTHFPDFKLSNYPSFADAKIEVVEEDCIFASTTLLAQGFKPAMLNMASNTSRGGGVLSGASAQEEDVTLRTTLWPALLRLKYRLPDLCTAYHPGIFEIRDINHAAITPDPSKNFAVISSAALNRPVLKADGKFNARDYALTKAKMELFFQTALVHGNDAIVPSAWGCGAYGQHPKWVARCFIEVLRQGYAHKFRRIRFAIIGGGNYQPFAAEFAGQTF